MRQTAVFMKNVGRSPQNENKVPFKIALPLVLRNKVSGKGTGLHERGCLYEISLVLSCLQQNNFEDKYCSKEVSSFHQCYSSYLTNKTVAKEQALKGILTPNSKTLRHNQINQLLRKYPNV